MLSDLEHSRIEVVIGRLIQLKTDAKNVIPRDYALNNYLGLPKLLLNILDRHSFSATTSPSPVALRTPTSATGGEVNNLSSDKDDDVSRFLKAALPFLLESDVDEMIAATIYDATVKKIYQWLTLQTIKSDEKLVTEPAYRRLREQTKAILLSENIELQQTPQPLKAFTDAAKKLVFDLMSNLNNYEAENFYPEEDGKLMRRLFVSENHLRAYLPLISAMKNVSAFGALMKTITQLNHDRFFQIDTLAQYCMTFYTNASQLVGKLREDCKTNPVLLFCVLLDDRAFDAFSPPILYDLANAGGDVFFKVINEYRPHVLSMTYPADNPNGLSTTSKNDVNVTLGSYKPKGCVHSLNDLYTQSLRSVSGETTGPQSKPLGIRRVLFGKGKRPIPTDEEELPFDQTLSTPLETRGPSSTPPREGVPVSNKNKDPMPDPKPPCKGDKGLTRTKQKSTLPTPRASSLAPNGGTLRTSPSGGPTTLSTIPADVESKTFGTPVFLGSSLPSNNTEPGHLLGNDAVIEKGLIWLRVTQADPNNPEFARADNKGFPLDKIMFSKLGSLAENIAHIKKMVTENTGTITCGIVKVPHYVVMFVYSPADKNESPSMVLHDTALNPSSGLQKFIHDQCPDWIVKRRFLHCIESDFIVCLQVLYNFMKGGSLLTINNGELSVNENELTINITGSRAKWGERLGIDLSTGDSSTNKVTQGQQLKGAEGRIHQNGMVSANYVKELTDLCSTLDKKAREIDKKYTFPSVGWWQPPGRSHADPLIKMINQGLEMLKVKQSSTQELKLKYDILKHLSANCDPLYPKSDLGPYILVTLAKLLNVKYDTNLIITIGATSEEGRIYDECNTKIKEIATIIVPTMQNLNDAAAVKARKT